ncbi:unnamed protein product [Rotaria socialis]|uniref:Uncharacterized protein n=1 Tax=Rotaria socialis TaxID=392032 RepID=A0A818BG93_9BILA|nr:unnamed protein product [Rotaria socialis]
MSFTSRFKAKEFDSMLVKYKVQSSLDMAYGVLHQRNIKLALTKLNDTQRPISRRQGDYDIEDPTVHVREKLIVFCQELVEAVKTRLEDAPSVFLLMKSCLDVSSLYEQVVLIGQQTLEDYGQSALQKLIDFTLLNSTDIQVKVTSIQQQYAEWKRRCLFEIVDKDTFGIWTTDGKIITSKVMKTFFYQQKASRWYS